VSLDKSEVAEAYVQFLHGECERLLGLLSDDFLDNVSGQRGREIWRVVASWVSSSFTDVVIDLHSVAEDGDGRVLVWLTLHGTHIGSAFPWMRDRVPSARRVAWPQLHVFRIDGESLAEHWAVRDDLRVLEAIDSI